MRQRFRGKGIVNALVDLPLALSPVVVGLAFLLLYSRTGWFGELADRHGIQVVFALPAMMLVTIFVSLPFVVREVVPVLREIGTEQEQAAATLGASPLADVPQGDAARDPLGDRVRRRADDGAGARRVRRGQRRLGPHRRQDRDADAARRGAATRPFDYTGAYAASVVLALIAIATLVAMSLFKPKEETR